MLERKLDFRRSKILKNTKFRNSVCVLTIETFGKVLRNKEGDRRLFITDYVATGLIQLGGNFEQSLGKADCG